MEYLEYNCQNDQHNTNTYMYMYKCSPNIHTYIVYMYEYLLAVAYTASKFFFKAKLPTTGGAWVIMHMVD